MDQTSRAKRLLDVEEVVNWACQELAACRAAPADLRPGGLAISRLDASLVGRWTFPPGIPSVSPMFAGGFASAVSASTAGSSWRRGGGSSRWADPDPDALAIEAAIGGLAARMAGFAAPEELALDIGLAVDIDGAFAHSLANVGNLLLAHGRMGNRPEWRSEPPAATPRLAANGKPGVWRRAAAAEPILGGGLVEREYEEAVSSLKRRDTYPDGSYGVIDWDPDPQAGVVSGRADYLAWRLGLETLAAELSGTLQAIAALPPAAALLPWLGEADALKPADLFGAGARRVYSRMEQSAISARRSARERRVRAVSPGKTRRPPRLGKLTAGSGR